MFLAVSNRLEIGSVTARAGNRVRTDDLLITNQYRLGALIL
jgi:hypothetical protein